MASMNKCPFLEAPHKGKNGRESLFSSPFSTCCWAEISCRRLTCARTFDTCTWVSLSRARGAPSLAWARGCRDYPKKPAIALRVGAAKMLAPALRAALATKGQGRGHHLAHNLRLAGCPGNARRPPTSNTSRAAHKTAARTAATPAPRPARL